VRDILAYLEVLHNPHDELGLRRIINAPPRGIGDKTIDVLRAWADREGISLYDTLPHVVDIPELATRARAALARFKDLLAHLRDEPRDSMQRLMISVIRESGYGESLEEEADRERLANLDELVTLGANFDRLGAENPKDPTASRGLEGFLETVCLSSDQDMYDEKVDRVPLMTLHAAKGLEFPAVFIAGCEDGLLPHIRHVEDRSELEEERRLFFVGITRSMKQLTLSHARFRRIRGRLERCIKSRFIEEIPPGTLQVIDETTGTTPSALNGGSGYSGPGPQRVVRPEVDAKTGLAAGEMVRHPTYGLGRVVAFTTAGGRRMVRVRFNTVGEKTLDPEYARLVKVAPA
jgi:DNA helicase-2/ATP-dependent DNA helicase PcrA